MKPSKTCSLAAEFSFIQESIFLQNERMTQVYVVQSEQNPFVWLGVLFIDSGIYFGSVIRFTVIVDESYPDCACPRVIFHPIPYHPLINKDTGELDTSKAFSSWNSGSHKLANLIVFIKRVIRQADQFLSQIQTLLDHINLDNSENAPKIGANNSSDSHTESAFRDGNLALNFDKDLAKLFKWPEHTIECVRLYQDNPEEFQRLTDDFRHKALNDLYTKPMIFGDDRNSLLFSQWVPELHEPLRNCILAGRFAPSNLFATYHKETDSVSFIPGSEKS